MKVKKQKDKGDPAKRAAALAARKGAIARPDGHVEGAEKEKATLDAGNSVTHNLKKLHVNGES